MCPRGVEASVKKRRRQKGRGGRIWLCSWALQIELFKCTHCNHGKGSENKTTREPMNEPEWGRQGEPCMSQSSLSHRNSVGYFNKVIWNATFRLPSEVERSRTSSCECIWTCGFCSLYSLAIKSRLIGWKSRLHVYSSQEKNNSTRKHWE